MISLRETVLFDFDQYTKIASYYYNTVNVGKKTSGIQKDGKSKQSGIK